jgi:RNA-directed DNA polymerase
VTIFTFEKLYKAYQDCIKRKKNTANALKFEMNREKNLMKLLYDLQTGKYKISRHICFVVTHPSPREIFAADFRDRIVHHLLCNEVQHIFEQDFSPNSYANRKNFGTHKAVKKVKWYIQRGGKNRQPLYFLKMDIKSFFRSIDKKILRDMFFKKIHSLHTSSSWKREVLWLANIIIFHNPTSNYFFKGKLSTRKLIPKEKSLMFGDQNKGLPIGNLTSQFFANVYMNQLDHFIEKDLMITRYARYVDDFVLFDESKERLKAIAKHISKFCENELNLTICVNKTILQKIEHGIDFLGYYLKPTHTLVRRKVVGRFKVKFFKVLDKNGFVSTSDIPMIQSYKGHFSHACSLGLYKKFKLL